MVLSRQEQNYVRSAIRRAQCSRSKHCGAGIVDDNRAFMTVAALVLERDGVAVVAETTSSAEALECLDRLRPDVTLVDIELGGESGFDLAKAIHRRPRVAEMEPAVILISARDEHDFADQVAASPALGFLPKMRLSAAAVRMSLAGVAERYQETKPGVDEREPVLSLPSSALADGMTTSTTSLSPRVKQCQDNVGPERNTSRW